jgi:hypothetical protein
VRLLVAVAGIATLVTALIPLFFSAFHFHQDLKKRYNATWALVTGAFCFASRSRSSHHILLSSKLLSVRARETNNNHI